MRDKVKFGFMLAAAAVWFALYLSAAATLQTDPSALKYTMVAVTSMAYVIAAVAIVRSRFAHKNQDS